MTSITNARFLDAAHTLVEAVIDGVTTQELGNGFGDVRIRAWIKEGNKPDPYVAPPPPPVMTKTERIEAMLAANGLTVDDFKAELAK
jgi:hypothetical protein